MEHLPSLDIFAEIGVALAGFSGVAAAIAGSSPAGLLPRQRIGFWMVLFCGFGVTIWALLPRVLANFALSEPLVWRSLCFAEAPFVAIALVAPWRYHKALERAGNPSRFRYLYWVLGPLATMLTAALLLAGGGLLPAFPLYYASLAAWVAFGATSFVLFLLVRPST